MDVLIGYALTGVKIHLNIPGRRKIKSGKKTPEAVKYSQDDWVYGLTHPET
jgi:hypothetical protein